MFVYWVIMDGMDLSSIIDGDAKRSLDYHLLEFKVDVHKVFVMEKYWFDCFVYVIILLVL